MEKSIMGESSTSVAVETVARESYSRLIAYLAVRTGGDLAAAEDALSDAFLAAMLQWPRDGVPNSPEAWLLQIAQRKLIDSQRRSHTRRKWQDTLKNALGTAEREICDGRDFPDERLKLLFVCAHPAIDPIARAPLMLQTIFGMDAGRIASMFLTSAASMSQRLVRAKIKIRDARIPFRIPDRPEWNERVQSVLDAIYAAYSAGRDACETMEQPLPEEALWLARALVYLMPDEPEALGLLSLILHSHARRDARVVSGNYVPLPEQDTRKWDRAMQEEAELWLRRASEFQVPGRFQLEAAIQSVHASRAVTGETRWTAIAALYDALGRITPTLGVGIGRAIAHAKASGPEEGLMLLDLLPTEMLKEHLPYWAARAHLLAELNRNEEASIAFQHAIRLCQDPITNEYLSQRMGLIRSELR
jgi:RNA polymerase sigma-70 factor, ECF subfamily